LSSVAADLDRLEGWTTLPSDAWLPDADVDWISAQ
jgi:hypothetical protein